MKLHVLAFATHHQGYLDVLESMLDKSKISFKILGLNEKWTGFMMRHKYYIEHLTENYSEEDIIMIIDAYDVLVLSDETEIVSKFNSYNADIIFATESPTISQPKTDITTKIQELIKNIMFKTPNGKIVLNGGSCIGKKKQILEMLKLGQKYAIDNNESDDQIVLNNIDISHINYAVDKTSNIFWIATPCTFYDSLYALLFNEAPSFMENVIFENNRIKFSNVSPCVIHGTMKRNMDDLCKRLGYDKVGNGKQRKYTQPFLNTLRIIVYICISIICITIIVGFVCAVLMLMTPI